MKIYSKIVIKVMITLLALFAGLYLGKYFFEPTASVSMVNHYPQRFADRTFKVNGYVSYKAVGIGFWIKIYWLNDPDTGQCLPVSTERSILPPVGMPITIYAKLAEPVVLLQERQLLLLEQESSSILSVFE